MRVPRTPIRRRTETCKMSYQDGAILQQIERAAVTTSPQSSPKNKLPRHVAESVPGQIEKERNSSIGIGHQHGKTSATGAYRQIIFTQTHVHNGHFGLCMTLLFVSSPLTLQVRGFQNQTISSKIRFYFLESSFPKFETTGTRATHLPDSMIRGRLFRKGNRFGIIVHLARSTSAIRGNHPEAPSQLLNLNRCPDGLSRSLPPIPSQTGDS